MEFRLIWTPSSLIIIVLIRLIMVLCSRHCSLVQRFYRLFSAFIILKLKYEHEVWRSGSRCKYQADIVLDLGIELP
jgi:hypothetical protein